MGIKKLMELDSRLFKVLVFQTYLTNSVFICLIRPILEARAEILLVFRSIWRQERLPLRLTDHEPSRFFNREIINARSMDLGNFRDSEF